MNIGTVFLSHNRKNVITYHKVITTTATPTIAAMDHLWRAEITMVTAIYLKTGYHMVVLKTTINKCNNCKYNCNYNNRKM